MKNIYGMIALVVVGAVGGYFISQVFNNETVAVNEQEMHDSDTAMDDMSDTEEAMQATTTEEVVDETMTVLGASGDGNDITAYHYGSGDEELLFVGGIHGGYAWNTVLLAYEMMDYLESNEDKIPANVKVTVIPVLNPDGLQKVVGTTGRFEASDVPSSQATIVSGRFNDNEVDLNRNFDCDWSEKGTWQSREVSGGTAAFSESESQALKGYVDAKDPAAVVAYYAAAGGVFASDCHAGVLNKTSELTKLYADASGYSANEDFDFYEVTGDMVNWLARERIPAISVLLTNHQDVEWNKNRKGLEALLANYADTE